MLDATLLFAESLASALIALAALLFLFSARRSSSPPAGLRPFSSLPSPHGAFPLIGHLLKLCTPKLHLQLTAWANQLGRMYRVRILDKSILVLTDATLAAPLLSSGDSALPKARFAYEGALDAGVPGTEEIFTEPDFHSDYYRTVRKGLALFFCTDNMRKQVFPVAIAEARQQIRAWATAAGWSPCDPTTPTSTAVTPLAIDATAATIGISLDILLKAVFKMELVGAERVEFLERLEQGLEEFTLRVTNPLRQPLQHLLPFLPWSRSVEATFRRMRHMWEKVYEHIQANAPYAEGDLGLPACFWRLQQEGGLTNKEVLANIPPLFVGGFETSAGTVSWFLYDIASNPAAQARLVSELRDAGLLLTAGTADGPAAAAAKPVAWEHLHTLPYFNAAVKESMRLHAVTATFISARQADKDVAVDGVHVPRGTVVLVPGVAMHCSEHNFGAALSFRPERWLEGGDGNAKMLLPFSSGPRSCIGQNMGNTVVRAVALELTRSLWFDVDPIMGSPDDVHRRQYAGLTLKCEGGIRLVAKSHV